MARGALRTKASLRAREEAGGRSPTSASSASASSGLGAGYGFVLFTLLRARAGGQVARQARPGYRADRPAGALVTWRAVAYE